MLELSESRDLRGGRNCWQADEGTTIKADQWNGDRTDIIIIGSGVMGAMVAERLASEGAEVVLLDRRPAAHGSTAASTALVMWGADLPLTHLGPRIGADEAARRWQCVHATVQRLATRIDSLGIDCDRIDRPELYLTGSLLDPAALEAEAQARTAAGLPCDYLTADAVATRFGIEPKAAILCAGSYEVDPVRLTLGLLAQARGHGARIHFPLNVEAIESDASGITAILSDGRRITADQLVLATGYERPTLFLPPMFSLISSYAIATRPGIAPLWRENALIWEASEGYIYARAMADGRVVAGGEDEDFTDPDQRDRLIEAKSGRLEAQLGALLGRDDISADCAWAASFGQSPDGLPAIGRAANHERLWLAAGFGGNGVSFAALGAEIIAAGIAGRSDPDASCFDPYRFSRENPEPVK